MKQLFLFLLFCSTATAQTVPPPTPQNNATVNIIGNSQNIIVNQSGANHSVNINSSGDGVPVSVTQSGMTPQSFSITINCVSSCPSTPYVVNQY